MQVPESQGDVEVVSMLSDENEQKKNQTEEYLIKQTIGEVPFLSWRLRRGGQPIG